jgi:hypothetical protein
MKNFIILSISIVCVILGAIVKLLHCSYAYSNALFIIGFIGFVTVFTLFVKNRLHKT